MKTLDTMYLDEVKVVVFDFDLDLEASETIGVVDVVCTVDSGTDATPDQTRVGTATVVGRQVLQRVIARVPGCVYKVRCKAAGSTGLVHVKQGLLPVTD